MLAGDHCFRKHKAGTWKKRTRALHGTSITMTRKGFADEQRLKEEKTVRQVSGGEQSRQERARQGLDWSISGVPEK